MHEYTCPECSAVMRSKTPAPAGRKIRCKKCEHAFVPGGGLALMEEEPAARPVDPDDDVSAYVVNTEGEDHVNEAVKYGEVQDKFKRSSRGPAMALMVLPTNLLIAQGGLMFIFGIGTIIYGLFPLVFADVEPSEDEYREQAGYILFGILIFIWACVVCFGASQAQNLDSYTWAWVGAVAGIPAGVFAAVMLRNPKVIAGFQEMMGALDDDEMDGKKEEDEDDDDEEDDDD